MYVRTYVCMYEIIGPWGVLNFCDQKIKGYWLPCNCGGVKPFPGGAMLGWGGFT